MTTEQELREKVEHLRHPSNAHATVGVSAGSIIALLSRTEQAESERARFKAALLKIDAIRNSIVGLQSVNWSEHIYPLVAALGDAGFEGEEYETARANVGTLIEQIKAAESSLKERDAEIARLGAAVREFCDGVENSLFIDRRIKALASKLRSALTPQQGEP